MTDERDRFDDIPEIEEKLPPGEGLPWGIVIGTIGLILLVVFTVQNTEPVQVEFLWLSGDFALSIVILVTTIVAALVTAFSGAFYRRRRRRRREEQEELRRLREDT